MEWQIRKSFRNYITAVSLSTRPRCSTHKKLRCCVNDKNIYTHTSLMSFFFINLLRSLTQDEREEENTVTKD